MTKITRGRGLYNAPKCDLIEPFMSPEEERARIVAQDIRFCEAMRTAIALGKEQAPPIGSENDLRAY